VEGLTPRTRARLRGVARWIVAILIGLVGAWLGLIVSGRSDATLGPFDVRLDARFGPGVTRIVLPPFGELTANTHTSPLTFSATLQNIEIEQLTDTLREHGVEGLIASVEKPIDDRVRALAIRAFLAAVAGGALLGLAVYRRAWKWVAVATLTALVATGGGELLAWATFRPEAFTQPTYSGTIALAPKLIGPVETATSRLDQARDQLARVVDGAARVYTSLGASPVGLPNEVSVLHISDIHLSPLGYAFAQQLARSFGVDFVVDTGDISSFGTPAENLILAEVPGFHLPYVYVRGNHDAIPLQIELAKVPNAIVLDGTTTTIDGLTIYGRGDPVFTPNKLAGLTDQDVADQARAAGAEILNDVQHMARHPDIVAVHDDRMAEAVAGYVPLVISGHFHVPSARVVDGTLYLRIGSTGGAGANVFTTQSGVPLSAEILHFDPGTNGGPPRLVAYDLITQSPTTGSLTIQRHLVADEFGTLTPSPTPPSSSPTPAPTASTPSVSPAPS
jgi:predicted phosphodiesterase